MRGVKKLPIVVGAAILMTLTSCSDADMRVVKIDDHIFHVLKSYLVTGTIPWLPTSQSEGLKFLVDPKAPVEKQMIVTMESSSTTCRPKTPPVTNQLSTACSAAERNGGGSSPEAEYAVEKCHRNGDPTQWEYRVRSAQGNRNDVVASCYSLSGKQGGLCTALNSYKDLVYSVGLRDKDISRLSAVHKSIRHLLSTWERAGSS